MADLIDSSSPFLVIAEKECVSLLERLLAAAEVFVPLVAFSVAGEAASYLSECIQNGDTSAFPQIVFIDLQLPRLAGITLLWWIRAQPALDGTPIIAMGSCKQEEDIAPERRLGSDCYVYKFPSSTMLRRVCNLVLAKRRKVAPSA